jgi:hypothetical protein
MGGDIDSGTSELNWNLKLTRREFLLFTALGIVEVTFFSVRDFITTAEKNEGGLGPQGNNVWSFFTGTEFVGKDNKIYLGSEYRARYLDQIDGLKGEKLIDPFTNNEISNTDKAISKAEQMLDNLHQQAAINLKTWKSEAYPGVEEVQTEMGALDLIIAVSDDPELKFLAVRAKESKNLTEQDWVVSSSTPSGGADGGPMTALDMGLDVMMRKLPEIVDNLKKGEFVDMKCIFLGSPIAVGNITRDWLNRMAEVNYFHAHGELHAESLKERLGKENISRVIFLGDSNGAIFAKETADRIPDEIKRKTTVLMDSPAPTEPDRAVVTKVVEAGLLVLPERERDVLAKITIEGSIYQQLKRNGVTPDLSENQLKLKQEAQQLVLKQVTEGPLTNNESLYPSGVKRTVVREGVLDLVTFNNTNEYEAREKNYEKILQEEKEWEKMQVSAEPDPKKRTALYFRFLNHPKGRPDVSRQPLDTGHVINRTRQKDAERMVRAATDLLPKNGKKNFLSNIWRIIGS